MKSSQEIADSIAQTVAGVMLRPSMYVGDRREVHALDCLLWMLLDLWAGAHEQRGEFRSVLDAVRDAANCGPMSFARAFCHHHPDASDEDCSKFVLQQWQIVAEKLNVPLVDSTGQRVPVVP